MKKTKKQHKLNREITAPEVRLGEHGIVTLKEALAMADVEEMDLVLISETAVPPVCKIMNYEKFIYEQTKKPKNKSLELKEVKLGPNTSENDLSYRTKHIIEFLGKGHKVKLSMQFRGRQMAFIDKGKELMLKLILSVEDHGSAEAVPVLEGKKMICTLKPKSKK
jgi:translation initiation factor IF-3